MKNSQIAISCALVLNLMFIILVVTGTWDTKSKVGCDPECGPGSKFEYHFNRPIRVKMLNDYVFVHLDDQFRRRKCSLLTSC